MAETAAAAIPLAWIAFAACWSWWLGALSLMLLISGADDLVPLLICCSARLRKTAVEPTPSSERPAAERRIAIFVPCWQESEVIGNMIRHNVAAIRYRNFDFFIGVYPNDEATRRAAGQLAYEFLNVHVALAPHPGPTSKADCLNAIYRAMQNFEAQEGVRFDTVLLHDAEDLIHPEALPLIDRERERYAMVQVPVLPLPTGFSDVTHGVYCDEFAEYQTIDMPARQLCGAFVPSNGVGTAFSSEILERLEQERAGPVFDPASLTEDYEIGVYIHQAGCYRQTFCPLTRTGETWLATREYFPRSLKAAVRQRTRWVIGIALQTWERHGWQGSWQTKWWFWRDRKGLLTNPLSVVANVLFIAGILDYPISAAMHRPWAFYVTDARVAFLCSLTLALNCLRLALRALYVGRLFGMAAALSVPLRSFHANLINCSATILAVVSYLRARSHRRAVAWQKTDHAYPDRKALASQRRALAEVLTGCGYLSEAELDKVQAELSSGGELDLLLLSKGLLSENELCRALSVQSGIPTIEIELSQVNARVVRGLPSRTYEQFGILPFQVKGGRLLVAASRIPSAAASRAVEELSSLPVEFHLVTPSKYTELLEMAKSGA
ncbi:MAG: glycosyl transferase family protein [Acidobacteriales bacterium]|nr:glycosyl transferase family protein [Terriglobales bacterium]